MSRQPRLSISDCVLLALAGLVIAYAVWMTVLG